MTAPLSAADIRRAVAAEAKAQAKVDARMVAALREAGATEYLGLVDAGTLTPAGAWTAYREAVGKTREGARKKAEAERRARSDLYSGIAKAVEICALYGGYEDIPRLMATYDPDEVIPQYVEALKPNSLRIALRFVTELLQWAEQREGGPA